MSNITELQKSGFNFKKQFGQNFLTDINLLSAIVADSKIDSESLVLEIGTGAGSLTEQIAKKAKSVVGFRFKSRNCTCS